MHDVNLGDRVTDTVTRFQGVATGRVEYITGCTQILVTPEHKQGAEKLQRGEWFDEDRLVVDYAGSGYASPCHGRWPWQPRTRPLGDRCQDQVRPQHVSVVSRSETCVQGSSHCGGRTHVVVHHQCGDGIPRQVEL